MAKTFYIYNTATSSTEFITYRKGANDLNIPAGRVLIHGGANLATKHLITPLGAVTRVTEEQLELLQELPSFQRRIEKGFITIRDSEIDIEEAVEDMESRDGSAPKTEEDFEDSDVDGTVISSDEDTKAKKKKKKRNK